MSAAPSRAPRIEDFLGEPPSEKRIRAKTISDSAFARATREATEMIHGALAWDEAAPRHFVALYAILHERVYGVAPCDLTPVGRLHAAGMAARLLEKQFGGERVELYEFVCWTWKREEKREKWRAEKGCEGGRIGPRLQFSGALLADYRVEAARARRRRG